MKWLKRILIAIVSIATSLFLFGYIRIKLNQAPNISYEEIKQELLKSEVPLVIIKTSGNKIKNEPKISAELEIYKKDSLLFKHKIGIEYRGKTSYGMSAKKSFSFEVRDNQGKTTNAIVLGMPADEDWNLIGNVVNEWDKTIWDASLLYNHIGYTLSRNIGRYASRTKLVELVIDGQYLGVYTLGEKLKRGKNRIDIQSLEEKDSILSGGYILAIDKSEPIDKSKREKKHYSFEEDAKYTPDICFRSNYGTDQSILTFPAYGPPYHEKKYKEVYYNYVYPKASKITLPQKKYIQNYINEFETTFTDSINVNKYHTYEKFIDINSFVDHFLINELCKNIDAYRLSSYLYKPKDGKLTMGPVWDLNIGFNEGYRIPDNDWVVNYDEHVEKDIWGVPFWWQALFHDSHFRSLIKIRWQELRRSTWSNAQLKSIVHQESQYLITNGAAKRNYLKWDKKGKLNYNDAIKSLNDFLINRANWMDGQIHHF